MGSNRWSDTDYSDRVSCRAASGVSAFAYHDAVSSGSSKRAAHTTMDPKKVKKTATGIKGRESRDSDAHPNALAIATVLDVTGSMSSVPRIIQENLPKLMGLLTRRGYVQDPHILTMAVGDATCDTVPLQVGQFESGIEIENDLTNLFLEAGGGGQNTESYELGMYFLAEHTSIDCFEKRNKKGYAFFIGDELPYSSVKKDEVAEFIGTKIQDNIPIEDVVVKLKEKYECFFILPAMTTNFNNRTIIAGWEKLFGAERVLKLQDAANICELIASAIGLTEGKTDLDDIDADLVDAGITDKGRGVVTKALSKLGSSGRIAKRAKGMDIVVAESGAGSGIASI